MDQLSVECVMLFVCQVVRLLFRRQSACSNDSYRYSSLQHIFETLFLRGVIMLSHTAGLSPLFHLCCPIGGTGAKIGDAAVTRYILALVKRLVCTCFFLNKTI